MKCNEEFLYRDVLMNYLNSCFILNFLYFICSLKNKLQYNDSSDENEALAKIQHLENLVFDLEESERKLNRKIEGNN